MENAKIRVALLTYLGGMVLMHAILMWNARAAIRKGYSDFTIYYCAGMMVRKGLGHDLYNLRTQFEVQREFAPEVANRLSALPYNHPPFEALLFVPFTYFSYFHAFIFWDVLNIAALLAVPTLLRKHIPEWTGNAWAMWMLASLGFFPVFLTLLQGQDSILLLLLYTLGFVYLKGNADALAGGWLALGLFKPQLVLPFVFIWMMRGRAKILYGFLSTATALALLSAAIVGIGGLASYAGFALRLESTMAGGAIMPSDMPNLRGVLYLLTHGRFHAAAVAIAISCVILLLAVWQFRTQERTEDLFYWNFALAIVTSVVVSYHCLAHDLSLLLLPIALVVCKLRGSGTLRTASAVLMLFALGLLFFAPLQLFLLQRNQLGAMGWAVLFLLAGIVAQVWHESRTLSSIAQQPAVGKS